MSVTSEDPELHVKTGEDNLTVQQIKVPSRPNTPPLNTSSIKPPQQVNDPSKDKPITRSTSAVTIPSDIELKIATQFSRYDQMVDLIRQLREDTSFEEIEVMQSVMGDVHKSFAKEHAYLEARCPHQLMKSNYFHGGLHKKEGQEYLRLKLAMAKLKKNITASNSTHQMQQPHLPTVPLPTFSGEFTMWPEFKSLFTSIVIGNQGLTNIAKLHYLKTSLKGPAADVIAHLPMTDATFATAWEKLKDKYENKRKLISGYISNIMTDIAPQRSTSLAARVSTLVTTIDNALSAIELLGQSIENWDPIIIHQVVKQLDDITKERWETSLGDNSNMPTYQQLKEFIAVRVRTLENLETASTSKRTTSTPSTSRAAVANITTSNSKYICDCCGQFHFIVSCPKFRALSPEERLDVVHDEALCFNCLARHSVTKCRMLMVCNLCKKRHHTMIHDALQLPRGVGASNAQ